MTHYKITVLEFGYLENIPGDFVYDGFYGMGQTYYYPFSMTLIQGEGHNILFDTGFNAKNPLKYERFVTITGGKNAHSSDEILATVGVKTENIDTVILSHAHWDHIGATELFPNAIFYIQRDEFEAWNRLMKTPQFAWTCWLTTDHEDIEKLAKLHTEGRLKFLDGEVDNFLPGLHIRVSKNAHSCAMQMLLIDNGMDKEKSVRYVLASDAYNYPDSVFRPQTMPNGYVPTKKFSTGDTFNSIETMVRINKWVNGDKNYAITTHDGSMSERFKTIISDLNLHVWNICD